jgi:uncharacterized protein involved in cysteine biosynthesis
MTQLSDVGTYLKGEAKFLGVTLLATAAGGVVGAVVGGVISLFSGVPYLNLAFVQPAFVAPASLGALAGFATSFIRRILA